MSNPRISKVRARLLGEAPAKREQAADAAQGSIFASIFSALEKVLEGPAKLALFPAATVLSWYKLYRKRKAYNKAINKNIYMRADVYLDTVAAAAETFAVGVAVTGAAIVSAAMIPAIFLGMIATKFVYHAAQTAWYGVKCAASWLRGDTFTAQHAENKAKFQGNLRGTFVLGAVGVTIGLLMFAPAWGLLALGAAAITAVKAVGAIIVAANVLFTGREIYKMRKAEKEAELNAKAEVAPAPEPEVENVGELEVPNADVENQKLINPDKSEKPTKFRDFYAHYKNEEVEVAAKPFEEDVIAKPFEFKSLVNHHDDLIRKMDMSDSVNGALQFVLDLIKQERTNIASALGATIDDFDTEGNITVAVDKLPWSSPFEKAKRYAKLDALASLEDLVKNGKTVRPVEGTTNEAGIKDVDGLISELQSEGKSEMVFKSSFEHVGGVQKVFLVASEYMDNIKGLSEEAYQARRNELSVAPAA